MLLKNKKLLLLLIVSVQILFFLGWYFIEYFRFTNTSAKTITVRTVPVDPRDLLSGNYIILHYKFSDLSGFSTFGLSELVEYKKCVASKGKIYAVLKDNGTEYIPDYLTFTKPSVKNYQVALQGECNASGQLIYGVEKYFVKENIIQSALLGGAEVTLLVGDNLKPLIKKVMISGVDLQKIDADKMVTNSNQLDSAE